MPIYEYHCKECKHSFEKIVRMDTSENEVECPSCKEHKCEREMSIFSGASTGGDAGFSTTAPAGCGGGSGFS